ncbi:GGDEF domain-containing protein [Actinophytocola oryzae]|uniref:GGDEF domain-containing protein n=1 Tax=Actinophytocola oryzae TaxID=502181 RepID=UPI001AAF021C|nr:GGDEF domain-containing protein [Actinophytocola oryzae]
MREADPRPRGDAGGAGHELRVLRSRWRTASIAAGWRFPSDWGVPEVDAVCMSAIRRGDMTGELAGLGRARAQAGAGLDETLTDLAALHAVLTTDVHDGLIATDPDAPPTRLVRAAALAWADASCGDLRSAEATDNLTNMTTQAYLRTRVGEVYRQAARMNMSATQTHALLVVTLDLSSVSGWPRLMAMVLVADALREVFDGGESIALLGPSVAAVLSERGQDFGDRALSAGWLITERLKVDPQLAPTGRPVLRLERLPATQEEARDLLQSIGRA